MVGYELDSFVLTFFVARRSEPGYLSPVTSEKFELEAAATAAYSQLLRDVAKVRDAFESAGLSVPDRVRRFLADAAATQHGSEEDSRLQVPPPISPLRPASGYGKDWLWVQAADMTVQGLVKALLRQAERPMQPKEIFRELLEIREANPGSVANLGTKLQESGVITRDDNGWALVDPSKAPVLFRGFAWGEASIFETYELAARRRMAVLHVLRMNSDGLQPMQLLTRLESCDWLRTPLSKDLLKVDLAMLDEQGKAKRVGNSGKWRATAPSAEK